jgi:3-isopropylmalate/(R)-2-methylmalate dehydratase small subunit
MLNDKPKDKPAILIGGRNFGCGSSREQAASTLKGHELTIIAKDFARIFLQNSINLGLNTIICPEIEAETDDEIEISDNKVINKTTGKSFNIIPLPAARKAIVEAGGLIAYTQLLLKKKNNMN